MSNNSQFRQADIELQLENCPLDWKVFERPDRTLYYFNSVSGELTDIKPAVFHVRGENRNVWTERVLAANGSQVYFLNAETGEVEYEMPPGYARVARGIESLYPGLLRYEGEIPEPESDSENESSDGSRSSSDDDDFYMDDPQPVSHGSNPSSAQSSPKPEDRSSPGQGRDKNGAPQDLRITRPLLRAGSLASLRSAIGIQSVMKRASSSFRGRNDPDHDNAIALLDPRDRTLRKYNRVSVVCQWRDYLDPAGHRYYHRERDGVSVWTLPAEDRQAFAEFREVHKKLTRKIERKQSQRGVMRKQERHRVGYLKDPPPRPPVDPRDLLSQSILAKYAHNDVFVMRQDDSASDEDNDDDASEELADYSSVRSTSPTDTALLSITRERSTRHLQVVSTANVETISTDVSRERYRHLRLRSTQMKGREAPKLEKTDNWLKRYASLVESLYPTVKSAQIGAAAVPAGTNKRGGKENGDGVSRKKPAPTTTKKAPPPPPPSKSKKASPSSKKGGGTSSKNGGVPSPGKKSKPAVTSKVDTGRPKEPPPVPKKRVIPPQAKGIRAPPAQPAQPPARVMETIVPSTAPPFLFTSPYVSALVRRARRQRGVMFNEGPLKLIDEDQMLLLPGSSVTASDNAVLTKLQGALRSAASRSSRASSDSSEAGNVASRRRQSTVSIAAGNNFKSNMSELYASAVNLDSNERQLALRTPWENLLAHKYRSVLNQLHVTIAAERLTPIGPVMFQPPAKVQWIPGSRLTAHRLAKAKRERERLAEERRPKGPLIKGMATILPSAHIAGSNATQDAPALHSAKKQRYYKRDKPVIASVECTEYKYGRKYVDDTPTDNGDKDPLSASIMNKLGDTRAIPDASEDNLHYRKRAGAKISRMSEHTANMWNPLLDTIGSQSSARRDSVDSIDSVSSTASMGVTGSRGPRGPVGRAGVPATTTSDRRRSVLAPSSGMVAHH